VSDSQKLNERKNTEAANGSNKIILSAGEISSYIVCPEAWRLGRLHGDAGAARGSTDRTKRGREMHASWADRVDEARYLLLGIRVLLYLLILAILILVYIMRG
jgi:hypothetical protein